MFFVAPVVFKFAIHGCDTCFSALGAIHKPPSSTLNFFQDIDIAHKSQMDDAYSNIGLTIDLKAFSLITAEQHFRLRLTNSKGSGSLSQL